MFIEERVSLYLQSRRDDMFIEKLVSPYPQSRRDDMFIEECVPLPLFSPVGTICL